MKKKVVIFTGAGISAESGISTYRDKSGIWEKFNPDIYATVKGWIKKPDLVTSFYNDVRKLCMEAEPNDGHKYLVDLEKDFDVHIITQNIDTLHERAGSTKVLHLHGNIMEAKSSATNKSKKIYQLDKLELTANDKCELGFRLRPNVVWFGEQVPYYPEAVELVESADIFIIIGTSLQVYPAANLAFMSKKNIPKFIIDPTANDINLHNDFIKIPFNAVNGVKILIDNLKLLND